MLCFQLRFITLSCFFFQATTRQKLSNGFFFHVPNIIFHADMIISSFYLLRVLPKTHAKCLASVFLLLTLLLSILPSFWVALNLSDKLFFNANMRKSTFAFSSFIGLHHETYVGSVLVMLTKHFAICKRFRCVSVLVNMRFCPADNINFLFALCFVLGTTLKQEPAGVSFFAKCFYFMIT
jgi:hypothetical protein